MSSPEYAELVRFLGQRFDTSDRRFDAIDRRFDAIGRRFDELRTELLGHFDEIYRRLERLEQEYQAIMQALRRIEGRLVDERTRARCSSAIWRRSVRTSPCSPRASRTSSSAFARHRSPSGPRQDGFGPR